MTTETIEQTANRVSGRNQWVRDSCKGMRSILDIGSANGWVFTGSGLNVTLLDINEFPPCELPRLVMDAHNLGLADGSFDSCVLAEILEHVHNPILVLKEAWRVASRRLAITVPDEENWTLDHKPYQSLPGIREREGGEWYREANPSCLKINDSTQALHNRIYTREMLQAHLKYAEVDGDIQITDLKYQGWSWICAVADKKMVKLNLGEAVK